MKTNLRSIALICAISATTLPVAAAPVSFSANLSELNGSNVSGSANLTLDGNLLTVMVTASGLESNLPHPQHIHGLFTAGVPADSTTPTLAQDTDGDGFIELAEGAVTYGPVLLQLTSPPGGALSDFPTASDGNINYSQTFDLSDAAQFGTTFGIDELLPLHFREIVLHGLTVGVVGAGTPGEVDGTPGYKAVLPVAAGEIFQNAVAAVPEAETYALMLAGLGLTFAARRPKKQR